MVMEFTSKCRMCKLLGSCVNITKLKFFNIRLISLDLVTDLRGTVSPLAHSKRQSIDINYIVHFVRATNESFEAKEQHNHLEYSCMNNECSWRRQTIKCDHIRSLIKKLIFLHNLSVRVWSSVNGIHIKSNYNIHCCKLYIGYIIKNMKHCLICHQFYNWLLHKKEELYRELV